MGAGGGHLMRRSAVLILLLATLALVPTAGHAAPADGGCAVVQFGLTNNCRYISHGPGVYSVTTVSGYRIQACPAGSYDMVMNTCGAVWRFLAGAPPTMTDGVSVSGGPIDTVAGEVVDVAIWIVEAPTGLRYQDGAGGAHDLG
jgi:hypothetical protein